MTHHHILLQAPSPPPMLGLGACDYRDGAAFVPPSTPASSGHGIPW
jgi:hypothetical protein